MKTEDTLIYSPDRCNGKSKSHLEELKGYIRDDVIVTIDYGKFYTSQKYFEIKKVIFNDPATIVYWTDGSKTVVKVQDGDSFDQEKGLAMAFAKKALGNKGAYCNTFKKWTTQKTEE